MNVQVQRSFVVPPPPLATEEVPFSVFDIIAPTYYVTALFAFAPPNPTNHQLLNALVVTLPRFPLLTAALVHAHDGRRPCFRTGEGGAGALVVEAEVPSSVLSDNLPLAPSPCLKLLHPHLPDGGDHLLLLQINRFACGGIVLASSTHHQVADGYSMSTFFHAWADAIRGDVQRPVVPYGPTALMSRQPPRCEFEHWGVEVLPPSAPDGATKPEQAGVHLHSPPPEISNLLLHYTSEFVSKLKSSVQNKYTTFETVAAHIWRKITAVRRLNGATRTDVYVSVNGRGRLSMPAAGFFGNLVLTAKSDARAADLGSSSLADAAALIHAAIRGVDERYFQSLIDFGAVHGDYEEMKPAECMDFEDQLTTFVEVDSWMHLELHRLDLGCGGRLAGVLPGKVPQDGVVMVMHSLRKGGGVEVLVALWEKHAKELRTAAYVID